MTVPPPVAEKAFSVPVLAVIPPLKLIAAPLLLLRFIDPVTAPVWLTVPPLRPVT